MQKTISDLLIFLQKQLFPRQRKINAGLFALEILLLLLWALALFTALNNPQQVFVFLEIGGKLGTASLLLFCLTLLPGIIVRLKVVPKLTLPIATLVTPFRRHLGILMFITAFVHMSFSSTLPYIALQLNKVQSIAPMTFAQKLTVLSGVLPPPFRLFEQIALIAWILLLPVWLTSNDFPMKKLGKWWKRLQRISYVALWLIFVHVALQKESLALILLIIGLLEIYSWMSVWRR